MTHKNKRIFFLAILLLTSIQLNAQIIDPVSWTFESKRISETEAILQFKAKIAETWHMYGRNIPENGPIPTSFTFTPADNYKLSGSIIDIVKPLVKYDSTFRMNLELFSNNAEFTQKILLNDANSLTIKGILEYMCCDDERCLPPKEIDFIFEIQAFKGDAKIQTENIDTRPIKPVENPDTTPANATANPDSIVSIEKSATEQISPLAEPQAPKKSLWGIFILSLLGGLAGLLTPCVYPIIPLTVGYFMREKKKAVLKGFFFGLSIVFIYTLIGLIAGLTGLDLSRITSHWLPNIVFFAIFLTLSISFLGAFEIMLPGSLANKVDQQADKGGFLGPFFMALATAIISFSCTGPIVGVLLGNAMKGSLIVPVVGMFGFALSFAAPFTLLAIFPGMLKSLPKSGGWLNAVKVFFAFILLAFSLKFLSNIDQSYHLNLISRPLYIVLWVVLFFVLGIYLLGKIKFSHDSDIPHIGIVRFIIAIITFTFALYLFLGIFGASLKIIDPVLPPPSINDFSITISSSSSLSGEQNKNTALCESPKYSELFHLPYNLEGYYEYDDGIACAKQLNKPVLLDFKGHFCSNCKLMESKVWSDERILKKLREDFIIIALYTDDKTTLPENEWYTSKIDGRVKKTIGAQNLDFQVSNYNTNTIPLYAILSPEGQLLTQPRGYNPDIEEYLKFIDDGISTFKK